MCVPQPSTFSCVYSASTSSTDGFTQIMQNGSAMGAMGQVKFPFGEVAYTTSLNFNVANDKGAILASVETNISMCGWAGMIQTAGTYRVNAGRPF